MSRFPIAKHRLATALLALIALVSTLPAHAAGEVVITHAKVLAGNVAPGDSPGYPVQIRVPGSYVLGSNLDVPAGGAGIQIFVNDVTIDLAGYRLFGNGKSALYGIAGATGAARTTIKKGTVAEFKFEGIYGRGRFWSIENMRVVTNGRTGVLVDVDAHIQSSTISENGGNGVSCSSLCLVERNIATSNTLSGIVCGPSCHAEGNVVTGNGSFGISLYDGLALGNTISRNGGFGISGGGTLPAVYGNNSVMSNNQGGVQAQKVASLHANYCYPGPCP